MARALGQQRRDLHAEIGPGVEAHLPEQQPGRLGQRAVGKLERGLDDGRPGQPFQGGEPVTSAELAGQVGEAPVGCAGDDRAREP
jgi:hypothetical protein